MNSLSVSVFSLTNEGQKTTILVLSCVVFLFIQNIGIEKRKNLCYNYFNEANAIITVEKIKEKILTRLILIRHGESEANREEAFAGWIDPDLHEKGLKQARITAKYIFDNYKVDKIYSSDLRRAYKTALCVAELFEYPVIPCERLREIRAGKWEGVKFSDIRSLYPDEYDVWMNHIGRAACVGGESVKELGERIMSALLEIAIENDGKTVVIGTHATPVRAVQAFIEKGSFDEMEHFPWVSNASVTVIEYREGKWKMIEAGADAHLSELKTVLPKKI